jgi:hypothetical protein
MSAPPRALDQVVAVTVDGTATRNPAVMNWSSAICGGVLHGGAVGPVVGVVDGALETDHLRVVGD